MVIILIIVANILYYDMNDNKMGHFLQLIIEGGAFVLFAYHLIYLKTNPFFKDMKMIIAFCLVVSLKWISLVGDNFMQDYYSVFYDQYGNYIFVIMIFIYFIAIKLGAERVEKLRAA